MRIRKRDAAISFAILFGGLGLPFSLAGAFVLLPHRGPSVAANALLLLVTFVGAFALFGMVVGLLFARSGDPPDE